MKATLLLIGCGKMGGALLEGWIEKGLSPRSIIVVEPSADIAKELVGRFALNVVGNADDVPADHQPDVVVLAVKPQMMVDVVARYRPFKGKRCVFLSIAAGRTIRFFEQSLGEDAAIVRAMPNTPAAIRRGMTVACGNANVSLIHKELCIGLLDAVGDVAWIEDESLMDAVTAVSGSGPAYVFLLAETLARAGVEAGLSEELATRLARATVSGAGELLHRSDQSAANLRQNVTSPGGTTAAALGVLMGEDGWQRVVDQAVAAAVRRSHELAG